MNESVIPNKNLDHNDDTPLYVQLKNSLAQEMISGSEGKIPPIRDIAKHYNISIATVIKAINILKDEGILSVRRGKGLFVKDYNRLSELYSKQSGTIGVNFIEMYNFSNTYLSEAIRGLTDACNHFNLRLQLISTHLEKDTGSIRKTVSDSAKYDQLDGLILIGMIPFKDIVKLQERKIPFVWLNVDLSSHNIPCVIGDYILSATMMLSHLAKLKHKKITTIYAEDDHINVPLMQRLCPIYGLDFSYRIVCGDERDIGYSLAGEVLESADRPDVLITNGSEMTVSAYRKISEMGLSLPEDLAFVGNTSSSSSSLLPDNITISYTRIADMAWKSVEMLQSLLNNDESMPNKLLVPSRIIVRGSCGYKLPENEKEIAVSSMDDFNLLNYPD